MKKLQTISHNGERPHPTGNSLRTGIILLLILLFSFSSAFSQNKTENPDQVYDQMVAQAKKQDKTLDFTKLRMAYTKTSFYEPYAIPMLPENQPMYTAYGKKDYNKTIEIAEKILQKYFLHCEAHLMCELSYKKLGNNEKSAYHHFVLKGIIESLLSSGGRQKRENRHNRHPLGRRTTDAGSYGLAGNRSIPDLRRQGSYV